MWFKANPKARLVAKTMVGPLTVSTVFLGFDHGWGPGDAVRRWSLMPATIWLGVPGASGCFAGRSDYGDRYKTGMAKAGHAKAVAWAGPASADRRDDRHQPGPAKAHKAMKADDGSDDASDG